MTKEKLERVLWRLRSRHPGRNSITNDELARAIMSEIGTDRRTISANRKAMLKLKLIKIQNKKRVIITDIDINGDY